MRQLRRGARRPQGACQLSTAPTSLPRTARPRPALTPPPPAAPSQALGELPDAYRERALIANLLADAEKTLAAARAAGLTPRDVSPSVAAALRGARDLIDADERVSVDTLAATLKARNVEAPGGFEGWYSYLTSLGLPDFDPAHWANKLRAAALRRRLVPLAQGAAERRPGALAALLAAAHELGKLDVGVAKK